MALLRSSLAVHFSSPRLCQISHSTPLWRTPASSAFTRVKRIVQYKYASEEMEPYVLGDGHGDHGHGHGEESHVKHEPNAELKPRSNFECSHGVVSFESFRTSTPLFDQPKNTVFKRL